MFDLMNVLVVATAECLIDCCLSAVAELRRGKLLRKRGDAQAVALHECLALVTHYLSPFASDNPSSGTLA